MDEFGDVTPHKMAKCIKGPIFVTLANESPARHYDSEDSTYDSFHARETGKLVDVRLKYASPFYTLFRVRENAISDLIEMEFIQKENLYMWALCNVWLYNYTSL